MSLQPSKNTYTSYEYQVEAELKELLETVNSFLFSVFHIWFLTLCQDACLLRGIYKDKWRSEESRE